MNMNLLINKGTLAEISAYKKKLKRSMSTVLMGVLSEWFNSRPNVSAEDKLQLMKDNQVSVNCSIKPKEKERINRMKNELGIYTWEMVDMAWKWWKEKQNG